MIVRYLKKSNSRNFHILVRPLKRLIRRYQISPDLSTLVRKIYGNHVFYDIDYHHRYSRKVLNNFDAKLLQTF